MHGAAWRDPAPRRCNPQEVVPVNAVDWGDISWLEEEPEEPYSEIADSYHRPISDKEKICGTCNIPKPCWCE